MFLFPGLKIVHLTSLDISLRVMFEFKLNLIWLQHHKEMQFPLGMLFIVVEQRVIKQSTLNSLCSYFYSLKLDELQTVSI